MSNLVLQCKDTGDFKPHPEGIHPAICVDVIDLGLVTTEFQGQTRVVNKLKLVFESEQKTADGKNCTVSKNFTASLHPKAKLAEFLGKWRGRPVLPGESIALGKLIGACCTLVISHQQNMVGRTYAAIDAVSKPTKKLTASGCYDPVAARQRIEEWKTKQASGQTSVVSGQSAVAGGQGAGVGSQGQGTNGTEGSKGPSGQASTKSGAMAVPFPTSVSAEASTRQGGPDTAYDPEVGF